MLRQLKILRIKLKLWKSQFFGIYQAFWLFRTHILASISQSNFFRNSKPKIKQKQLKSDAGPNDNLRKKSLANTSGASILYVGKMSQKDRRLLKMILVIFMSFLTCYLPITLTKVMKSIGEVNFFFIMGYLLVYLTTCINPIIYVVSFDFFWPFKSYLMISSILRSCLQNIVKLTKICWCVVWTARMEFQHQKEDTEIRVGELVEFSFRVAFCFDSLKLILYLSRQKAFKTLLMMPKKRQRTSFKFNRNLSQRLFFIIIVDWYKIETFQTPICS